MKLLGVLLIFTFATILGNSMDDDLMKKANELAQKTLIIDTHIDVPFRIFKNYDNIAFETEHGDFDYPRAKKGGLNAAFMSIFVPAKYEESGGGKKLADSLINIVEGIELEAPEKFKIATSVNDVLNNFENGLFSLPLGMENGTPIEGDLKNVQYFYDRGIRYITLTHGSNNHIGDSSYEEVKKHHGLTEFGKKLIPEMNRVGIIVDISHVSDETFYDVMKIAKVPCIASHSSCRYFTPGFERNMDDKMIKTLAENGGVIQITFGSSFISKQFQDEVKNRRKAVGNYVKEHHLAWSSDEVKLFKSKYYSEHPLHYPDVSNVVDHIEHVINLVGIDYVGLGSDFDGVGDSLPIGLKDVSYLPNIIYHLLKRGYSEEDIQKICSGNLLRVWKQVEEYANLNK